MSNEKTVIIGAGLSGLAAAYELKKAGRTAIVYEASKHVGGRCRNAPVDGYPVYVGAGCTEPQWETTFQYLKELGIQDKVHDMNAGGRVGFLAKGKTHIVDMSTKGSMISSALKFLPTFSFSTYTQGLKFLNVLKDYGKRIDFEKADFSALEEISDLSIAEWAQRNKMMELNHNILDPVVSTMVCANSNLVSMGHLVLLMNLMKGICVAEGGMGIIPDALYNQVKDMVHFSSKVEEVVVENDRVKGVKVNGEFVAADNVIVGLDAQATLKTVPGLSAAQRDALEKCGYSKVWYYFFGTERPVKSLENTMAFAVNEPGTVIASIGDARTDPNHCLYMAESRIEVFDTLADLEPAVRDQLFVDEIRKYFPDFPEQPRMITHFRWNRAVNLEGPGQFKAVNDLKARHMNDIEGLYLAGDYLFLIASTEGSMDAGKRAAFRLMQKR